LRITISARIAARIFFRVKKFFIPPPLRGKCTRTQPHVQSEKIFCIAQLVRQLCNTHTSSRTVYILYNESCATLAKKQKCKARKLKDFFPCPAQRKLHLPSLHDSRCFETCQKPLYIITHFNILFYPQNFPFMPAINLSKKMRKARKVRPRLSHAAALKMRA